MQATAPSAAAWRRSSHSGGDNGSQCVELAFHADKAAVRDSKAGWNPKHRIIPALVFPAGAVAAFVVAAKRGELGQH